MKTEKEKYTLYEIGSGMWLNKTCTNEHLHMNLSDWTEHKVTRMLNDIIYD